MIPIDDTRVRAGKRADDPATAEATSPDARNDAPADPGAAAPPPAPRASRRLPWILLGAGAFLALFAYGLYLKSFEGDYLVDERWGYVLTLRMDGLPRWGMGHGGSGAGDRSFYFAGARSVSLGSFVDSRMGSGGIFDVTWVSGTLARDGSEPNAYRLDGGPAASVFGGRAERFPRDALRRYVEELGRAHHGTSAALLAAARELHTAHPDRLTTRYWLVSALCRAHETEEARGLVDAWRAEFAAEPTGRGAWLLYLMEADLLAGTRAMVASRGRFATLAPSRAHSSHDLEALMAEIAALRPDDLPREFSNNRTTPNFLSVQVTTKLVRVWSVFLMADGRRDEAHALLRGAATFSTVSRAQHEIIGTLIAIACRAILLQGLVDGHLHADASAEELAAAWREWEAIWDALPRYDSEEVLRGIEPRVTDLATLRAQVAGGVSSTGANLLEVYVRLLVTESRRELLREGMRARHHRAARGAWPAIGAAGRLEGLLLEAARLPVDPFRDPPAPLAARQTTDSLTLWSIGPDVTDDGGAIMYDPTNGSTSVGDLVLTLDDTPRYRFPAEPGHVYAGLAEFTARYPHGLPLDPFSNGGKSPLQLTTDGTGFVWSYGPDADESAHASRVQPGSQLSVLYDPTNGTTSVGDVYRKLNFSAAP